MVFWDLRVPLLEVLWRHHVRQARINPLLDALDASLSAQCSICVPNLHPRLAEALLHAATAGVRRVLLHGGPDRCSCVPRRLTPWRLVA